MVVRGGMWLAGCDGYHLYTPWNVQIHTFRAARRLGWWDPRSCRKTKPLEMYAFPSKIQILVKKRDEETSGLFACLLKPEHAVHARHALHPRNQTVQMVEVTDEKHDRAFEN